MLTLHKHVFMLGCMEALYRAIAILKTQSGLAKAIGRRQQDITNWIKRGRVPADHCPLIERVTAGQVTCEQLRPDINWADRRYMPDQKAA